MGYQSPAAKALKDTLVKLGIKRSEVRTKQYGQHFTGENGKRYFEPHYTIARVEREHYAVIVNNAQVIADAGNTVIIYAHKCGKLSDVSIHCTGSAVERHDYAREDCNECTPPAKPAPFSLPFEPGYLANTDGGTDVRNGNGELVGWTYTDAHGRYVATVPNAGNLGAFDSDQGATDAVLRYYGTPVQDTATDETTEVTEVQEETTPSFVPAKRVSGLREQTPARIADREARMASAAKRAAERANGPTYGPDVDTEDLAIDQAGERAHMTQATYDRLCAWTVAYQRAGEPVAHRETGWSGTWDESTVKARELMSAHPELRVWYVSTRAAELSGRVCVEDIANILDDDDTRIPIADDGDITQLGN